jgi:hypothetical protein
MTTTLAADHRSQVAFHLTGVRMDDALQPIEALRPALFAAYGDLTRLRYDFPVVLLRSSAGKPFVSLSQVIDGIIEKLSPPAADRDRVRKVVLHPEPAIRRHGAKVVT